MRPQIEPLLVVQEELPVAGDSMPHEQERHGRLEWSEARVVDRSPLVAFVVRPEQDSVLDVRRNCKMLQDVVELSAAKEKARRSEPSSATNLLLSATTTPGGLR